jgi:4-hydroxybenzoate polyprenyltransferase
MLWLLATALTVHAFAYVLNDVVDLPLDRSQALRADYPLVRGVIAPRLALVFALAQVPLALALTAALDGSAASYAALGLCLGLIAIYDVWGKRIAFAPLMDVLQGAGWGALVLFGALESGRPLTLLSWSMAIFTVLFITLLNGVHGGLRDLENDLHSGAHTTAIMLGARPQGSRGVTITPALVVYSIILQVLLVAVTFAPLLFNWFGYQPATLTMMVLVTVALTALSLGFLVSGWKSLDNRWSMIFTGTWHLVITLTVPIVLLIPYLDRTPVLILSGAHVLPLLTSGWMYGTLNRWQIRAEA